MIEVKKVSEIGAEELADYLRVSLDDDGSTTKELNTFLSSAIAFIKSYIGEDIEYIDDHPEFVTVVYVLVQDMYDNRTLYPDKSNLNYTVKSILDMHTGYVA